MSLIAQQIAEAKLIEKYLEKATEEQLAECKADRHISEDQHYQGVHGEFLKDCFPRRCKVCGEWLIPDEWEPVEPTDSDCEHETIGYCSERPDHKTTNKFPQKCKKCGIGLKPKTWKELCIACMAN